LEKEKQAYVKSSQAWWSTKLCFDAGMYCFDKIAL